MKFYDRKREIEFLSEKLKSDKFEFGYLLWKRRVWKTTLVKHLLENVLKKDFLYIFVEKSDLNLFLEKQEKYIYAKFWIKYNFESIDDFLDFYFKQNSFNVIIFDEFQNFWSIDKSIFSTFQKKIDEYSVISNKKIVVLGSIQSLMIKIFEDIKEPLYKRSTFSIFLKEFDINTQIEILNDFAKTSFSKEMFLDLYAIFWWVPYYFKSLEGMDFTNYSLSQVLSKLFFDDFAILRNEWKELLIEEFWQKYKRFFAILEAISIWKNKRNEIMDFSKLWTWEIDIYLKELREIYDIIAVDYPLFESQTNISKYKIKDNFLNFWFNFIYHNNQKFQLWLYDVIIKSLLNDWNAYLWLKLEDFVKQYLIEQNKIWKLEFIFTHIWYWRDRNNNELDLIYTDDEENICFVEIKLNSNRINKSEIYQFNQSIEAFLNKYPKFKSKHILKKIICFNSDMPEFEWINIEQIKI